MVPTAWMYSIQFRFWPPQLLHQHLHPHLTYHLGSRTYPLPPDLHWTNIHTCMTCTDCRIRATSTNKWPHHFVYASLYTTTLVYPLVTTSTLYWIITNTSATYTTRPSCSLLHWLLMFSTYRNFGFWATVCKTVRPMVSDRCLSVLFCPVCLSVTFVHCSQTVVRIKMKLGMQVGPGPGHIVLDGDPAPPHPKGHSLPPIFGPYLLLPNGYTDQDVIWQEAMPCVRWGPSPSSPKRGWSPPPQFFRAISTVAKWLDASRCHLVWM